MELKELLGEELYNKVMEKVGADNELQFAKKGEHMIPKHRMDEVIAQRDTYKGQVTERDKQIEDFGKLAKGHENLTKEVERLTAENKTSAEKYQADIAAQKKGYLFDSYLRDKKAKNPTAVKALFDLEKITVDGDKLIGVDEQYSTVYKGNEYMFEATTPAKAGAEAGKLPGGNDQFADFRKM